MEYFTLARIIHILAVILWIGGVAMVTTVIIPAIKKMKSKEEIFDEMASIVPMNRLADPNEVAAMIVYLASEQAGYITGQTIAVAGGVIKSTY